MCESAHQPSTSTFFKGRATVILAQKRHFYGPASALALGSSCMDRLSGPGGMVCTKGRDSAAQGQVTSTPCKTTYGKVVRYDFRGFVHQSEATSSAAQHSVFLLDAKDGLLHAWVTRSPLFPLGAIAACLQVERSTFRSFILPCPIRTSTLEPQKALFCGSMSLLRCMLQGDTEFEA